MPSGRAPIARDATAVEATPRRAPVRNTDEALSRALLRLFVDDTPPRLESLRRALAAQDAETVARQAHALLGGCRYVGAAARMTTATQALLELGRRGTLQGTELLVVRLYTEFEKIRAAVDDAAHCPTDRKSALTNVEDED